MTYRSDSDVPIPYGRTVALPKPIFPKPKRMSYENIASLVPYWNQKRRDVLVTILMSHCRTHRINYVRYLRRLINIDFYGKCSYTFRYRTRCPGHFNTDCDVTANYLFYLVLENTSCRQYMTEKLFYNAYLKGAIPIIRNPSLEDCQKLLPPNSFLHADQFNSPVEMVNMIKAMGADDELLLSFHAWRNHFNVTNEHGFFNSKSSQMCRLCQALNYNDKSVRWYDEDDIRLYLDPKLLCTAIPDFDFGPVNKRGR
ncbi:4-galactosyl-N-acetylglucosaminide 3-alpha-L-fucosyltransferase 9-like [Manduca sexta]|nr:4-galactosyl-N-acetylglucosaminide 3-alpha-L-fucosyltransferase 9-like [Manduca sexta]